MDKLPKVVWRSHKDRERTPDSRTVKGMVDAAAQDVFGRFPVPLKLLWKVGGKRIEIVNHTEENGGEWAEVRGCIDIGSEDECIVLNIGNICFDSRVESRLRYIVAHEMGHWFHIFLERFIPRYYTIEAITAKRSGVSVHGLSKKEKERLFDHINGVGEETFLFRERIADGMVLVLGLGDEWAKSEEDILGDGKPGLSSEIKKFLDQIKRR